MNQDQKTIDELSNDYRQRWREQPISVEDFLDQRSLSNETSSQLAIRLIKHEIELRRSAGESCSAREYQDRFPAVDAEVLDNLFSMPAPPPVSVLKPLLPNRYQPIKQIGKGGIGSVWQVNDRDMERTLAVKVLHTKLEKDSSANRRLRREAMVTGSLQHPGIPPVFEYGSLVGGSNYFAMKLVEGETLDRAFSKLSQTELLSVFRQIAEAVGFAHSKNVIHRDLKPQNVMVGAFGEVQIMDWGMARQLDCDEPATVAGLQPSMNGSKVDTVSAHCDESVSEDADSSPSHELTRVGEILGTPAYMAPEQARGESASIDARSDVFGLGAILFAMLTGKRIYQGHSAAEMISVAAKGNLDPAFLTLYQTELDADLRDLCKDCLQPKADDRPADASVVAERIGDYQNNVQNRLRQAELDQRATLVKADEQRKRTRAISWMSGLAILLTTAGLIGVTWQWSNAAEARSLAVKRLSETRNTVDEFYTTISEKGGKLALNPGTQELRKELLQKAKDYYVNFVSEYSEDEEAWLEMARAYKPLIEITAELDPACDEVFELIDAQKDLLSKLINKNEANAAKPEFRRLRQGAQFKLFRELTIKGAFEEALVEREKCEEFVEDWIALEDCLDARLEAAEVVYHLGFINRKLKRHADSIVGFNKSLAMLQPLYAEHPDHRGVALSFANANNVVGAHHLWFVEPEDKNLPLSNDHMELAVEINEQLVEAHPEDYDLKRKLASALNNLGMIQWNNEEELKDRETRAAASRASFERGVAIDRELAKNHPAIPYFRKDVAKHLNNLSTFYFNIEEIDEQMKALRESSEIINEVCSQHPQVDEFSRSGCIMLDEVAAVCGLGAEAEAVAQKSLKIHENRANNSGKADHKIRWALRKSIVEKTPSPELLELTASFSEKTDSKKGPEIVARAMALLRNNRLDEALTVVETFKAEKDSLYKFAKGLVLAKLGQKEPSKTLLSEGQAILSKDKHILGLYYYRLLLEDELKKVLAESEKQ